MKSDPGDESAAEELPEAVQERIVQILDDYLTAAERGEPIHPEELIGRHPEYSGLLRGYLSGLRWFHDAAAGIHEPEVDATASLVGNLVASGATIGDYRLIREVGRGGMGVVFEAEQLSLKRRVALKVLLFANGQEEKNLIRFQNEAQAAACIDHPHIVPVYAVGEDKGLHYYAMPLIVGRPLTDVLVDLRHGETDSTAITLAAPRVSTLVETLATTRRQPADASPRIDPITPSPHGGDDSANRVREAARLGVQAAQALHAAHELGVVHRDVKPSNLLVDNQGKLWITDFGLARCRRDAALTQTGDILGTLRYMSPEQAKGEAVDHRTDIYSLGVTLYELATLHHPAGNASDMEMLLCRGKRITPPRQWDTRIPRDFQTIVLKALAESPGERYATAAELADDLQRFLDNKPIRALPPSLMTHLSKWAHRRRRTLFIAAALLAAASVWQTHTIYLLASGNQAYKVALETAQENLREAHAVVDRSVGYVDQLAAIPGADGVRHQMLDDSLAFYRRLEQKSVGQPALAEEQAIAYGKMGALSERLGKPDESLGERLQAVAAWRRLLSERPSADAQRRLAISLSNAGLQLTASGRVEEALELLEESATLLTVNPSSRADDAALAATRNNLGMAHRKLRDGPAAAQEFEACIAILVRLVRATPDDDALLRELAASYNNLASLVGGQDAPFAVETYEQAVAIQLRLVKSQPTNRLYQADLARTYNNLGYLLGRSGDLANTEACYANSVRVLENLVAASPLAAAYRRDLAVSLNNLARVQSQADHPANAESTFRRAITLQRMLASAQPDDARTLSNLGGMYNNLGLVFQRLGRHGDAESSFREAVRTQLRATQLAPSESLYADLLKNHRVNLERHLEANGDSKTVDRVASSTVSLQAGGQ